MTEQIRETTSADGEAIWTVHRLAFGGDEEAELTRKIMADPSALPVLSLIAVVDSQPVGHILFSAVHVGKPDLDKSSAILAPLAIVPEHQGQGIGGRLIKAGLQHLRDDGFDLVFVLGHPDYYPRHGFEPAGRLGFEAPYPIAEVNAAAWMAQGLKPGALDSAKGQVACCDALNRPEYWVE